MGILTENYWTDLAETQVQLKNQIEQDHWRLDYHLMPETGWMNDPNGLCQFNGTYHFYHQYEPSSAGNQNPIHWGHKTSKDLVHFQDEPIFLSPENEYDRDGVYSGSALVKGENIHFFYTGNVKNEGDHDYTFSGREQNTVHVVSKDGFTIDSQEVIIPHAAYPEGFTDHIRDPKVFKKGDLYYMLLGARDQHNEGKILIYQSSDLYHWEYQGIFFGDDFSLGFMWECPDFFESNGQEVLVFSPQGVPAKDLEYQNIYQAGYIIGQVDWENLKFSATSAFTEFDRGFDFYAPQTFEDEQGRRILFGWMGLGNTTPDYSYPTLARGWQHAATLPRELVVEEGTLKQRPLPEYQKIRQEKETFLYNGQEPNMASLKGSCYEMIIKPADQQDFSVFLRQDTVLAYQAGILTLKHGLSGYGRKERSVAVPKLHSLQLFMDQSSMEVFVNDGEYVITSRIFPADKQTKIDFSGPGVLAIEKWDLMKTTTN